MCWANIQQTTTTKRQLFQGCVEQTKRRENRKIGRKKLSAIAMRLPLVTLAILPAYAQAQNSRHRWTKKAGQWVVIIAGTNSEDRTTPAPCTGSLLTTQQRWSRWSRADRQIGTVNLCQLSSRVSCFLVEPPCHLPALPACTLPALINFSDKNVLHRTSSSASSLWPAGSGEQQGWSKQAGVQFWQRHHHEPGWSWLCPLPPPLRWLLPSWVNFWCLSVRSQMLPLCRWRH